MCENPEQVDPTPFNAKAGDEVGKRWRSLGVAGNTDANTHKAAAASSEDNAARNQGKNGLKTIINILKHICSDVHDFEQGLARILDQDPRLLPSTSFPGGASMWPMRAQAIKARIRLDLDSALRAHQSAMGALLLTFMTAIMARPLDCFSDLHDYFRTK